MSLSFSLEKAPISPVLKENVGLPWGASVQPFAEIEENRALQYYDSPTVSSSTVSRCRSCYAYVNGLCTFEKYGWVCSLCAAFNEFTAQDAKYSKPATRRVCVELREGTVELVHRDEDEAEEDGREAAGHRPLDPFNFPETRPSVLFLVDAHSPQEYLATVASAASAALESCHPGTLCGIASFGGDLEVFDMRTGASRRVPLNEDADPSSSPYAQVELAESWPLEALLRPLSHCRDRALKILEGLAAQPQPHLRPGQPAPKRNFGAALQALLRFLGAHGLQCTVPPLEERSPEAAVGGQAAAQVPPPGKHTAPFVPPPVLSAASRQAASDATASPLHLAEDVAVSVAGLRLFAFLSGAPITGRGAVKLVSSSSSTATDDLTKKMAAASLGAPGRPAASAVPLPPMPPPPALPEAVAIDLPVGAAASADFNAGGAGVAVDPASRAFYEEAGMAASALGTSVDLFIHPSTGFGGVDALSALASTSGGSVFLYSDPGETTVAQDVMHRMAVKRAIGCMMRLRTSSEFRVGRAYGHLVPDDEHEDLHHAGSCDPHASFAFDFEFTNADGFSSRVGVGSFGNPCVQLAFVYSTVTPVFEQPSLPAALSANGSQPGSGSLTPQPRPEADEIAYPQAVPLGYAAGQSPANALPPTPPAPRKILRWVLQRRLRIMTVPMPVAHRADAVFKNVDPDTCCSLLVHKLLRAVASEGLEEARTLLRDWLVLLVSCCVFDKAEGFVTPQNPQPATTEEVLSLLPEPGVGQGSIAVDQLPVTVQPLPRLVYALLRSPLLRAARDALALDRRGYLEALWTSLAPEELSRAVYPCLSSFVDPETPAFPRHTLARAALGASGCPLFLLDAYDSILVFYGPSCPREMPFPPPSNSLLRKTVQVLRSSRRNTPTVAFLRAGVDDVALFEAQLIEEPRVDAASFSKEPGYLEFADDLLLEVREYCKENYKPSAED